MSIVRLTEQKLITVWTECMVSPVYLQFFMAGGGSGYWLFATKQLRGLTTKEAGVFLPFVDDLETAEADIEFTGMNVQPQLLVGADGLTDDQQRLIETLIGATRVTMLMNPTTWETEGPKWQTVRIQPGSFKTLPTNEPLHSIELLLNLVQINQPAR